MRFVSLMTLPGLVALLTPLAPVDQPPLGTGRFARCP